MDRGGLAAVLAVVFLASAAVGSPEVPTRSRLRGLAADAGGNEQNSTSSPADSKTSNLTALGSVARLPGSPSGSGGGPLPPASGGDLKSPPVAANATATPASASRSPPPQRLGPPHSPSERPPLEPGTGSPPTVPLSSSPSEAGGKASPGGQKGGEGGRKEGNGDGVVEKCYGTPLPCPGDVIACFWRSETGTKELFILVQNKGSNSVTIEFFVPLGIKTTTLAMNSTKKIKLPSDAVQNLVLNVGGRNCSVPSTQPVFVNSFFQQLPAYATPEYGAYALVLSVLVAGGAWACCKWRKIPRVGSSVIAYQQLEMGVQEPTSVVDTHVEEGWDEGWNNSWEDDDEEAGPRSKGIPSGVSANDTAAIPSKTSVRDEWEDWDD